MKKNCFGIALLPFSALFLDVYAVIECGCRKYWERGNHIRSILKHYLWWITSRCPGNGSTRWLCVYDAANDHYYLVPANSLNSSSGRSSGRSTAGTRATYNRPDGGTYTFSNPVIESSGYTKTDLLSVSYIPVAVVAGYLINSQDTSLMGEVKSLVLSGAVDAAIAFIASRLEIAVVAGAITAMVQLSAWNIKYANYNAIKQAYNSYCSGYSTGGLIVTTKCTYNGANGTGNIVTTFAR